MGMTLLEFYFYKPGMQNPLNTTLLESLQLILTLFPRKTWCTREWETEWCVLLVCLRTRTDYVMLRNMYKVIYFEWGTRDLQILYRDIRISRDKVLRLYHNSRRTWPDTHVPRLCIQVWTRPKEPVCSLVHCVWGCIPIQTYTQYTRLHTSSLGPQPQHPVLNTIRSSTQPALLKMNI